MEYKEGGGEWSGHRGEYGRKEKNGWERFQWAEHRLLSRSLGSVLDLHSSQPLLVWPDTKVNPKSSPPKIFVKGKKQISGTKE